MNRFKRLTIAALAAATVTVASHATTPSASAMPMSCSTRLALGRGYMAIGAVFSALGDPLSAIYYYAKAEGIMASC
jgi:hypothetical protein